VLSPYRSILVLPGALAFSAAGLLARLEIAMVGLGSVLLVQRLTGSYALGGAVSATFGVSCSIVAPFVARQVDRHGQARMLRLAAPVHAAMLLALVLAAVLSAPRVLLFVFAALAGASQLSVGSLVRARWAGLLSGTERMQTAFALESVLDEVVFIVGPIVVTLLATLVHPAVGLLVAAASAVAGAFLLAAQARTQPPATRDHAHLRRHATGGSVLRMRGVLVLVLAFLTCGVLFGGAEVSVAAFTRAEGVPAAAGAVLSLWAIGSMTSGLVYGAIRWRSRVDHRFVVVLVLLGLGTVPMLLVPTVPLLAVVFLVAGAFIAPVMASGTTLVESLVPPARLTEGLAWTGTALNITYALSAAVTGAIIDGFGPRTGFAVPVAAGLLGAVAGVVGLRRLRPHGGGRRSIGSTAPEPDAV
jgi:MFS family permease